MSKCIAGHSSVIGERGADACRTACAKSTVMRAAGHLWNRIRGQPCRPRLHLQTQPQEGDSQIATYAETRARRTNSGDPGHDQGNPYPPVHSAGDPHHPNTTHVTILPMRAHACTHTRGHACILRHDHTMREIPPRTWGTTGGEHSHAGTSATVLGSAARLTKPGLHMRAPSFDCVFHIIG